MERQKHVSREQVMEAVERLLNQYGQDPIPVEAFRPDLLSPRPDESSDDDFEAEITHVDAIGIEEDIEQELDMGDMVSAALDPSIEARVPTSGNGSRLGIVMSSNMVSSGADSSSVPSASMVAGGLSDSIFASHSGTGPMVVEAVSYDSSRDGSGGHSSPNNSAESSPSSSIAGAFSPVARPQQVAVKGSARPSEIGTVELGPKGEPSPSREIPIDAARAPSDDEIPPRWSRYPVDGELARGGQGRILNAFDEVIGRPVALKILRKDSIKDSRLVRKFYEEAQVTGQLEHPNIVAVHEFGWTEGGLPYYTMRKVEGRTLKKVIIGLRKQNPQVMAQYGRIKLLTILQQACMAISFAHDRGVLHRDLKPANIMLGDYGEVIVLDWGVAKVRGSRETDSSDSHRMVKVSRTLGSTDTLAGTVEGTPAYMSPEQARGRTNEIDERTDVYALGAILYEILTFRPPFRGQDVREVLRQVVEELPAPPSVVAPHTMVPDELELIAMRCLAKNPADRYESVKELQAELEAFLEGTKRRMAAAQKVAEARELVKQHLEVKRELLLARMVARRASDGIQGWEPIERKRGVWATRSKVEEVEARIFVTFGEAVARFSQALAHEPDNLEAREGLAELFMNQLKKAETERDHSTSVYCESMIRQYGGVRYAGFLKGDGYLTLETNMPGAEVWLYRYEEADRILRPVDAKHLGYSPVVDIQLPRGSYLLVLRQRGMRDVYYPVTIGRLESIKAKVNLYAHAHIGDGFVFIPGGSVTLGGDLEAIDSLDQDARNVPDFAIQEFPVTFREYCDFLNAWLEVEPEEANRHLPQLDSGVPLVVVTNTGFVPIRELIMPDPRNLSRPGLEYDVPVFGLDYDDADAYCAWRTEVSGQEYRLPREEEWEKAARGADGRAFPWGSQFDPTFCKSRQSRPWTPEPEPCGSFPEDTSPYGVRDMAGGVREWCDGWFNEFQGLRVLRGGAWVDTERFLRSASRSFYDPYLIKRIAGFRCARSLS